MLAEIRELAREQTEAAIQAFVDIMQRGKSESARVAAAQALLDRGWGKPTQALEHSGPGGAPLQWDFSRLTDEELVQLKWIATKATMGARGGNVSL